MFCLWSWDVNSYSSHVSSGTRGDVGWKLGLCRGEGVSGNHGINFRPTGTCGLDEWELSSPSIPIKEELGSTLLCLSCVFLESGWSGNSLWFPSYPARLKVPMGTLLLNRSPFKGGEGVRCVLLPDLDVFQLRAPLVTDLRF